MLDIFRNDAFSLTSLVDGILKAPYVPGRIGALGLFQSKGIRTKTAVIEEKDGRLSLIQTTPRGGPASSIGEKKRTARSFIVPHLQRESLVYADELQDVRAFGTEDQTSAVQAIVDERLADLRQEHEVTLEHMRAKAIQGILTDADGTTIYNMFTEFGVTQQTADIDVSADDVRDQVVEAMRLSERAVGNGPITGFRAFCGDHFFDAFIGSAAVRDSLKYQESALLRTDVRAGFDYGGVTFENYRGRVNAVDTDGDDEALDIAGNATTPFFADGEAYLVPIGPPIFKTYFAPADFIEAVNTVGLPIYVKSVVDDDLQRWVKLHSQSNPLVLCVRPRAVIKLTITS